MGIINKVLYKLMLKTLNYININPNGVPEFIFLAGQIGNIKLNN